MDNIVKFGDQVVAILKREYGTEMISRPNATTVRLRIDKTVNDIPIRVLYNEYQEIGGSIEEFLKSCVEVVQEVCREALNRPETWDDIKPHLALTIATADLEDMEMHLSNIRTRTAESISFPSPLPGLHLNLTADTGQCIRLITKPLLAEYGKDIDEAIAFAMVQTPSFFPKWISQELGMSTGKRLVWSCDGGTGFGGTVVSFPSSWTDVPIPSDRIWVACPTRNLSLAFDSCVEDPDLAEFADFVWYLFNKSDCPVSPLIYGPREKGCMVAGAIHAGGTQGSHNPT